MYISDNDCLRLECRRFLMCLSALIVHIIGCRANPSESESRLTTGSAIVALVTADNVLFSNEDIISYNWEEHELLVTPEAGDRLRAFSSDVPVEFMLFVNRRLVYAADIRLRDFPVLQSMNILFEVPMEGNRISITLGQLGPLRNWSMPDLRDDAELFSVLQKHGKIVKNGE